MAPDLHTRFALTLHGLLGSDPSVNAVCSPWSVSTALAVLAAGADEPTRAALDAALGGGETDPVPRLASDAATVAASRAEGDESVLAVADTLWVDEECAPTSTFSRSLGVWPGSGVQPVPIVRDAETARRTVNADVSRRTRGLVPEVVPPGGITPEDRAVLVNALYLLAGWTVRFDPDETTDRPFHAPGGARPVPTMSGVREVPYANAHGWHCTALPLGLDLDALLLLPERELDRAEPALDARTLASLRAQSREARVTLTLPRFRVEAHVGLTAALEGLGLGRLLTPGARPLPHVVETRTLYVSAAFHGAVLRLDERGVEGGAATALVLRPVAFRRLPEVELRLDRPFLVLLTHRPTGAVLFLARVVRPEGA